MEFKSKKKSFWLALTLACYPPLTQLDSVYDAERGTRKPQMLC